MQLPLTALHHLQSPRRKKREKKLPRKKFIFIGRFEKTVSQLWSLQAGIVLIISLYFHNFFSSSAASCSTSWGATYSYHKLEVMFESITANKSSSKHRSDQNTEERRCVSMHCSHDVYIYYLGTGRIPGKELDGRVLAFLPPNMRTTGASWH